MNKKLKKELEKSFAPPKLNIETKNEFLEKLDYEKPKDYDVFFVQLRYIRKRFWVLSLIIVCLAFVVLQTNESSYSKTVALSSILPLLTMFSVGEISKSISFNMYELEMSCKYNLQKITLIQMAIVGTVHLIVILLLILVCNYITKIGLGLTLIYCITPYILVNYISLFVINKIKIRDNLYICNSIIFVVSLVVYNIANDNWLFNSNTIFVVAMSLIILTVLYVREFVILVKERDDVQCHSKLTV